MAKRKRTVLPRVTVMAMNRKDLVAFVLAVEALGLHVRELGELLKGFRNRRSKVPPASADVARPGGDS